MKRRKTSSNHPDSPESQENESLDSVYRIGTLPDSSVDRIGALPDSSVDRISALPDSCLGLILSCLPTKNAVATSILSKRWKFVWRTVHNLDFYHWGLLKESYEGEDMRFVEFVNRVLLLNDAPFVNRFRLFWKLKCISVHVNSWISIAITRNVQELILRFENRLGPDNFSEPIEIPINVFTCASLRSLELNGGVSVTAAHAVWLPRLEKLELISVNFRSEIAFAKLISGCPMLNYLKLYMDVDYILKYFGRKDHFMYIIHSTSLRRLEICFEYRSERPEDIFYCSLILQASSLEYFKISGYIHEIFVGKRLNSLVEADFRIKLREFDFPSPDDCNLYVEAVQAFDCAKILTLSSDAMWALSCATISLSTKFKRLVKLETHIYCFHCSALRQFIQSSDNLEVLTIYQRGDFLDRVHNATNWIAPLEVPRCLPNTLKKVVLDTYCGFEDERETIGYMLKHGSVLEFMKINLDLFFDDVKLDMLKDICKFPRKSPSCEVEFVVDVNGPPVPVRSSNSNSVSGSNDNAIAEETVGGCVVEQPKKVAGSNTGSNDNAIAEEIVGGCTVEQPKKVASESPHGQ